MQENNYIIVSEGLIDKCPSCGNILVWEGVHLVCKNEKTCHSINVKKISEFVIKMGIEKVSIKTLENYGIDTFEKLLNYKPSNSNLKSQKSFQNEIFQKIINSSPEKIIKSLYWKNSGVTNITKILNEFGIDFFTSDMIITNEDDLPIGIGNILMEGIYEYREYNKKILDMITNHPSKFVNNPVDDYFDFSDKQEEVKIDKLNGKSFLITGTLSKPRKQFEDLIVKYCGVNASSVSKNLDYLIVGAMAGSKLDKAQKLNIQILNEKEFLTMVGE